MTSDIETTDIKASHTVSRVLWTLLNSVFESDDDDESLSFDDKELLEDVLRYGTLSEVAKRRNKTAADIRGKLLRSLSHLEKKIKWIEDHAHKTKPDDAEDPAALQEETEKYDMLKADLMQRDRETLVREILYLQTINRKLQEDLGTYGEKIGNTERDYAARLQKKEDELTNALMKLKLAWEKEKKLTQKVKSLEEQLDCYDREVVISQGASSQIQLKI